MDGTFGDRLRKELKTHGMTQRQLAEKLNLTEVSVSRYIKGDRNPRANTLFEIAEILGCPVERLIGEEEPENIPERDFNRSLQLIARSKNDWSDKQKVKIISALMGIN